MMSNVLRRMTVSPFFRTVCRLWPGQCSPAGTPSHRGNARCTGARPADHRTEVPPERCETPGHGRSLYRADHRAPSVGHRQAHNKSATGWNGMERRPRKRLTTVDGDIDRPEPEVKQREVP